MIIRRNTLVHSMCFFYIYCFLQLRIEDSNSDDEDIYKVPRNVVSIVKNMIIRSSIYLYLQPRPLEDEEDLYKVPSNIVSCVV